MINDLKPLKDVRTLKNFGVFDIETFNMTLNNFAMIGVYDGEVFDWFDSMERFVDYIFDHKITTYYAHNGGAFDDLFLLDEVISSPTCKITKYLIIGSGLGLLEIAQLIPEERTTVRQRRTKKYWIKGKLYRAKKKIQFRDTYKILPDKLANLTKKFNKDTTKQDFDVSLITKITPEVIEYCRRDCVSLYELINQYIESDVVQKSGLGLTTASQALKYFKSMLHSPIPALTRNMDSIIRKSYFGGRTEVFKRQFESESETLKYVDINSLYPYCMKFNDMPSTPKEEVTKFYEDEMGFYDVTMYVPDMYIPPLPYYTKVNGTYKLIFPTGVFRSWYTSVEIMNAINHGCKISKVHSGILFHSVGRIFERYVDHFYNIRLNTPKSSFENYLAKLMMNSLYGRFGMDLNKEEITIDDGYDECGEIIGHVVDKNGKYHEFVKRDKYLRQSFNNVAIASFVTSHARVTTTNALIKQGENCFYTDTDSMFTKNHIEYGDSLGEWKLEDEVRRAYFLLPKTYYMDTIKGENMQKIKGFERAKFDAELWDRTLNGESGLIKYNTREKLVKPRSAYMYGNFLHVRPAGTKEMRATYDKRRCLNNTRYFDTEPLVIKGDNIINLDRSVVYEQNRELSQVFRY